MRRSIEKMLKKISCLIMVCVLVISSYPIQAVAADTALEQSNSDKNDSNDKALAATSSESTAAENPSEPKSPTTENSSEPESPATENPSEPENPTTENPSEPESPTTENSSEPESSKQEDTMPEDATTGDDATKEDTTEEDTTSEDATTEEDTTEEDTTEEDIIVFAMFAATVVTDVTVGNINASVNTGTPKYVSGKDGQAGYFKINVSGSAQADFHVVTTGDNIQTDSVPTSGDNNRTDGVSTSADDNRTDAEQIKSELASQYRVELRVDFPSGDSKTLATEKMSVNDGGMSSSVSCSEVVLKETGNYQFYTVVTGPDGVECQSGKSNIDITIPDPIGVEISDLSMETSEPKACKEGNNCTGFEIPYTVTVQVRLTGIDGTVPTAARIREIEYCLSQYELSVMMDQQALYKGALQKDNFDDILTSGNELTYTIEERAKVPAAGTYTLSAAVDDNHTAAKEVIIEKLATEIQYSCDTTQSNTHEYGEIITYTFQSEGRAGDVNYYESDADGNRITVNNNLMIQSITDNSFQVTGMKLTGGDKPFYVTIEHIENEVYKGNKETFPFYVTKAKLEGSITAYNLEDNGKRNYNLVKTKRFYIDVAVEAPNGSLSKEDADKIEFNLQACFNSKSQDAKKNDFNDMEVRLTNTTYGDNKVTYQYCVSDQCAQALRSDGSYVIKATANYKNFNGEVHYQELTKISDILEVKQAPLKIEAPKEITVELNNNINHLDYKAIGERVQATGQFPVSCELQAADPSVIELQADGTYKTLTAGSTTVTITADDSSAYDFYEACSVEVLINVVAPSNTDYTLNGLRPEEFLDNPKAAVDGEKWYDKDITLCFGEENIYDELYYRVDGKGDWIHVNAREFVISESMPTTYEFYFCDTERKAASCIINGNEVVKGKLEVLEKIAVDTTAPTWNPVLSIDQTPSAHSTKDISYFPAGIKLTGYTGQKSAGEQAVDSGSGIQKLLVQYGDSDKWETLTVDERYGKSYTISLSQNKNYGTVKIKAVDYLGHESEPAEYTKKICIDSVEPVITATPVDTEGKASGYDGSWTNQQLRFAISSLEDTQVSGIYCYEYAFIPRGSKTKLIEAEWHTIDQDELQLVFGTVFDKKPETKDGNFLYSGDNNTKNKAVNALQEYTKMNGTLYFRAESNAGLVTTQEDINATKRQLRIWQEDLADARVTASTKPDAATGWYNIKTGTVNLSFEYPEYDAKNMAPAIGIVYTLSTRTEKDGEPVIVNRTFYKGMIDEASGKIVEVRDYNNKDSIVNLSKDGVIEIDRDSINTLTVQIKDAAGNQSDITVFQINADYTAPQNLSADVDGETLLIHLDSNEGITYKKFSQNAVRVSAQADYGISEKKGFYMDLTKEQGAKAGQSSGNARDELVIEPCNRGLVYLCAVDGAGNISEAWTDGIVVDNLAPTGGSSQEISIVAKGKNENEFYNKDIPISICVVDAPEQDNYSGLKTVTYQVGNASLTTEDNVSVFDSNEISLSWEQISRNRTFETDNIVIDAAKNESNNAYITVTATDYAGNITTTTQEFKIDITAPQVEITFDNNEGKNGAYYNSNRVARVDITEVNFVPEQVTFKIYKDGEEDVTLIPSAASWDTSEGNVHTAYITFAEDGDYSLEVQCTDLAGNESEKAVTESFTIDQTKPVVEIAYDNNNAWRDNYYNQARTATITVTEHNFDEKDFMAVITPHAVMSGWTHNGDVHKVSIRFDSEEYYSYSIDYTDLAGNEMEAIAAETFYIDMSLPEIQISGVADHSANAGEVVPVVTVTDANYDTESVWITLQNSKGQQIALNRSAAGVQGGYSYTLTNVDKQPDEIYTLTVKATDMAGNTSELSYLFSLNREGSVYDLSQINALVDKGYIRYVDMQDLQIKEMNVNTIEQFDIYVTRNGELIASTQKNARPHITNDHTVYYAIAVNGNDETGYEYDYTIYKESFQQEGIYNIMFYSKDKAGNEVNNTLTEKEAKLTFIIDNTAPTVVIEGVEAGELYSEETREVNVYVSDNFKLQEAYFKLVDEDGVVVETYDYMELAKEEGEIVTITLPSSDKKLSLQYYAADAAGNDVMTLENEDTATSFMISTNAWVRYINNKKAIVGTIAAGISILVILAAGVLFRRKRKPSKL